MNSKQTFFMLFSYARRYWVGFAAAVAMMAIIAATETAFPAMMKPFLDKGFSQSSAFPVWLVPVAVLLIFLVRGSANFVAEYAMQWVSNNVLRDLRNEMFDRLIHLPASVFDARSSGQLIAKLISESQFVMFASTTVVTILIRDSLIMLGLLSWLFYLNWKLTLVVLLTLPPLAILTKRFSSRMRHVSKAHLTATANMSVSVEEAISGNRVIKVFGGEHLAASQFHRANSEFRGQAMRLAVAQALQSPINQLIGAMGVALILTIWVIQSRSGAATIGDFVSFVTAMLMMFSPLRHLSDINSQLQRGLVAAQSVFSLIDDQPEVDIGTKRLETVRGEIRFERVFMTYPSRDQPALSDVSLVIPAGKTIAVVGPSGGGKSTLINLLPRIYPFQEGRITLDGVDIQELSLSFLRKQIALVSQDVVLFNASIADNISYGHTSIRAERIEAAVQAADLTDFVQSLPQGLNTLVGDRGVRVSGGQRQRIAIARAILKDAPILILDEATSALDSTTEASIKASVEALRKNRTTIVVAHRLSTVVDADLICVFDQGKLVQQGTHAELVVKSGLYQSLYSQMQILENTAK